MGETNTHVGTCFKLQKTFYLHHSRSLLSPSFPPSPGTPVPACGTAPHPGQTAELCRVSEVGFQGVRQHRAKRQRAPPREGCRPSSATRTMLDPGGTGESSLQRYQQRSDGTGKDLCHRGPPLKSSGLDGTCCPGLCHHHTFFTNVNLTLGLAGTLP